MTPPLLELLVRGALVHANSGPTWGDGGTWSKRVYKLDDRFWEIHTPTNYRSEVKIAEVFRHEKVVVTYTKEPT